LGTPVVEWWGSSMAQTWSSQRGRGGRAWPRGWRWRWRFLGHRCHSRGLQGPPGWSTADNGGGGGSVVMGSVDGEALGALVLVVEAAVAVEEAV